MPNAPIADVRQLFALSVTTAPTDAESQRLFAALGDGGVVQQPLIKTFFSSQFGMVADRFVGARRRADLAAQAIRADVICRAF